MKLDASVFWLMFKSAVFSKHDVLELPTEKHNDYARQRYKVAPKSLRPHQRGV
jgi:hypothetical protein